MNEPQRNWGDEAHAAVVRVTLDALTEGHDEFEKLVTAKDADDLLAKLLSLDRQQLREVVLARVLAAQLERRTD